MAGVNATEVSLELLFGDSIVDIDGIMAALSGASSLIYTMDDAHKVVEVLRAARIVRDQLGRLQLLRNRIDEFDVRNALGSFDLPLGELGQAGRPQR